MMKNLTQINSKIIFLMTIMIFTLAISAQTQQQIKEGLKTFKDIGQSQKQQSQKQQFHQEKTISTSIMRDLETHKQIQIFPSIRFQPQIQEYSIVKQFLYPSKQFQRHRNASSIIKKLQQKLVLQQNEKISHANEHLNKLNNQLIQIVENQHQIRKLSTSVQKETKKLEAPSTPQFYQKPNKEQDKKKNSLIQQIKKQLKLKELIQKENQKKAEQKKIAQEQIKRFDELQKETIEKANAEQQEKRKEHQKQQAAKLEQIQRKRKRNHERYLKQQQMQMKQFQIGFSPQNGQNSLKMLQLRRKKIQAERRQDQAIKRSSKNIKNKEKYQQGVKLPDQIPINNADTNLLSKQEAQKVINDLIQKNNNQQSSPSMKENDQKGIEDSNKADALAVSSKVLQNQFDRIKIQKEQQFRKKAQQYIQQQQTKKESEEKAIKQDKQLNANKALQEIKNSEKQKEKQTYKQEVIKKDDSQLNPIKIETLSSKAPQNLFAKLEQQQIDKKKLKQQLLKRIEQYQKEKQIIKEKEQSIVKLQTPKPSPIDKLPDNLNDNILEHTLESNLVTPLLKDHAITKPSTEKHVQQDTDTVLYEKLQERRKKQSQAKEFNKQSEKVESSSYFLNQKEGIFSDLAIYFIFGVLLLIIICLRSRQTESQQYSAKDTDKQHENLRGTLIPEQEIDD